MLDLNGASGYTLSPVTANFATVFNNTIQRPETLNCVALGTCPSGKEVPLLSSINAMDKRNGDNAGFFRNDSDLAIVVLSDEDEASSGPSSATQPQEVIDKFNSIWGGSKKNLRVYGIIIKPGDISCLKQQSAQSGGIAFEGNLINNLVQATEGVSESVCAADYSETLKNIGKDLRQLTDSVTLKKTPIASTVNVVFTPAQNIQWSVSGKKIIFETSPAPLTTIKVFYQTLD